MRLFVVAALAALADLLYAPTLVAASDSSKPKPQRPCTVRSPATDRFFDLTPIWAVLPDPDGKKSGTENIEKEESWHARGYDYNANFTVNFCGPVVEELEDVEGVPKDKYQNISAFYIKEGKTYSLGMQNAEPVFRGRKLILNYTDGSPCGGPPELYHSDLGDFSSEIFGARGWDDDDEDKPKDDDKPKEKEPCAPRKKTTIISLLCETDPLAAKAVVSFVAATDDECTYIFEARTHAACAIIEKEVQTLGPSGVFGVIFMIAILVYMVGGCVYQRHVMHQRGWRQLPNYPLWAGIWGFLRDMVIIFTSSCARCMPSRAGYNRVGQSSPSSSHAYGRAPRSSHSDDENRLIDQLDEEWDD